MMFLKHRVPELGSVDVRSSPDNKKGILIVFSHEAQDHLPKCFCSPNTSFRYSLLGKDFKPTIQLIETTRTRFERI